MIKDNEYHNIVFSPEMRESIETTGKTHGYAGFIKFENACFEEVVTKLAKDNPTWRLVITNGYAREQFRCGVVGVTIDGEEVGTVRSDYIRGNYGVRISSYKLENDVRSSNTSRALTTCRKAFVKRNTSQKLSEAERDAVGAINTAKYQQGGKLSSLERDLSALAFKYAMEVVRDNFVSQLLDSQKDAVRKYDEAFTNMATIQSVHEAFHKHKTALIVREGDRYIVKIGDDVALYTSAELPDNFKGKVGLLKLCEDGQMVDNVGCRVNEEVFVVLVEGANDE